MQNLDNLIFICQQYKEGKYDVEEFQSRILAATIPEGISRDFVRILENADNELERIIFCEGQAEHRKHATKVADELIRASIEEQKRLPKRPYAD